MILLLTLMHRAGSSPEVHRGRTSFQYNWLTLSSYPLYLMHWKSIILRKAYSAKTAKNPWLTGSVWSNIFILHTRKQRLKEVKDLLKVIRPLCGRFRFKPGLGPQNLSFVPLSEMRKPVILSRIPVTGSCAHSGAENTQTPQALLRKPQWDPSRDRQVRGALGSLCRSLPSS